jgi:quinol monooxygenase YgiN
MVDKEAVIVAQAIALPGNEVALRAAIDEVIPPSLAEAGVELFRLHEDTEKPGHFVLYERFANQAAFDSHFSSSHLKKVVGGGKPDITRLRQLTV